MLKRTRRRRVVEEEVTEVVSDDNFIEALLTKQRERQEREERERREQMKYELDRLESFTSRSFDVSVLQRLAKAGFYNQGGTTECFSCGLYKHRTFWQEGLDPETVHREESPDCKFISGQSGNMPIERWMKYEQNRLNSFPLWWLNCCLLDFDVAQRLAKAGFYRWSTTTECFSCGLYKPVSLWREKHDPETVHREESPDCKFITGQSDNVQIDNELSAASGPRRFQNLKSNKSQQTQEVKQANNNQIKLLSEDQQLKSGTGAKPKRIGENDNTSFFNKILRYVRPSRKNNRKTLNNKTTTQQVDAKEQISNQFESNSQGSIVDLVTDTDVKHNKISQETKKEAKFRNPRNAVRAESIEENTITFTSPEPDVRNEKAASGSTCPRRHLISATRGSCSSQEINQNSVIVSQSLQSSAFTTQTITSGSCVTSFDISERRSPIVSPIAILCLTVYYKSHIFLHFLIQLL